MMRRMLLDPGRDDAVDPRVVVLGLDRDRTLDHAPHGPLGGGEDPLQGPAAGRPAPARGGGKIRQQGRALLLQALLQGRGDHKIFLARVALIEDAVRLVLQPDARQALFAADAGQAEHEILGILTAVAELDVAARAAAASEAAAGAADTVLALLAVAAVVAAHALDAEAAALAVEALVAAEVAVADASGVAGGAIGVEEPAELGEQLVWREGHGVSGCQKQRSPPSG